MPIGSHVRTRKHTRIAMHIPGTHARIARCTPGPLERALVTPHKSIQSLRSRRTREAEWETRSVEVWAAAAICECVATAVWAGHEAPESSTAAEPKLQVLHNHRSIQEETPAPPDPSSSRICVSPRLQTPRPTAGRNRRSLGRGRS